jgi:hypothetical protein
MYIVYWSEKSLDGAFKPSCKEFLQEDMIGAMKFMEGMRKIATEQRLHCITMSGENPDQVGKMGVDVVDSSYGWTKRRNNMPGLKKNKN